MIEATGDAPAGRLLYEIQHLQRELNIANQSVDDKLDKLEEAGLDMVGLTNALESARQRILSLEKEMCMLNSADNISGRHVDLQKSYDNKLHRLELQDKELQDLRDIVSSHSNDMRDMHYKNGECSTSTGKTKSSYRSSPPNWNISKWIRVGWDMSYKVSDPTEIASHPRTVGRRNYLSEKSRTGCF